MNKVSARRRRSLKTKARIKSQGVVRLTVHRSSQHMYAQVVELQDNGQCKVVACASTLEKDIKSELSGTKVDRAKLVGLKVAERAKQAGVSKVAFDRAGYLYHGRVKALADGAREGGLDF